MVGCRRSEEEREGSGGAGGVLESAQQLVDEWVTVGEAQVAQAVVETVTHSGKQVDGERGAGWGAGAGEGWCAVRMASALHFSPPAPTRLCLPFPPEGGAASTGVAVAAFQQLARQMAGKHVVIVACGGNVSGQEMERMYEAVRRAAAA